MIGGQNLTLTFLQDIQDYRVRILFHPCLVIHPHLKSPWWSCLPVLVELMFSLSQDFKVWMLLNLATRTFIILIKKNCLYCIVLNSTFHSLPLFGVRGVKRKHTFAVIFCWSLQGRIILLSYTCSLLLFSQIYIFILWVNMKSKAGHKERNCMTSTNLITDAIDRAYLTAYQELFGDMHMSGTMLHCE